MIGHWNTPNAEQLLWFILLAAVFVINIFAISRAYQYADLTIMMPFAFSQLIFIAILAYLAFGHVMAIETVIGSIIIIGSTSYIAYRERKAHGKFLAPELGKELKELVE